MILRPLLTLLLSVFFVSHIALNASAQSKRRFKEGDAIEYFWVSKWLPGTVVAVEGNRVAIDYEWGGSTKREIVGVQELRFAWEARALSPMRLWKDETGKFTIRAAVMGFKDDQVLLYKTDDDTEISVPIAKLGKTEQTMLAKIRETAGPQVTELPELTVFTRQPSFVSAAWNQAENLASVSIDAPPSYASVPMKGVAFPRAHFFEHLMRVEPIGGSDGWMVAGTVDQTSKVPSRIIWAALNAGQVKRVQLLPPGERLTAVDPSSRQLLTVNTQNHEAPRLTTWTADPSMEVATPLKSWESVAEAKWGSWDNWGAIVAKNRVMHEWGKNQFIVWDTDQEREVYRLEQESFFDARPVLSPGKRYLALPEDERVRIVEAATGHTLASLPVEGGSSAGAAFSPDGKLLAILTRSQLAVWKLESSDEPKRYRADSVGTPFTAIVEWVDDHSLLIDRKTLFDTTLELPVWSYSAKTFEVQKDSWGEQTMSVLAGKLCYAIQFRGTQDGFVIGAVDLPGPKVREVVEALDPESLYIIRRGHRVGIKVECGSFDGPVRTALMKQIEDNGWVFDNSSNTYLEAKMGRGETQTVTYRMQNGRGQENNQSVTVTPYFSTLTLMHEGTNAWMTGGGSGVPPVMFLLPGQSAQSKVDNMQRPDPELFSRAEIPEKIFDPKKKNGLGSSLISSQGLTPQ
ncbi:MAG: SHD1 domain-containing protein [Pirellulaceae bacterium]